MSVRCEVCTKRLGAQEIAHGIRYGTTDPLTDAFIPSRDSAPTIMCQSCGSMLLNLIYQKLNPSKPHQSSIF